MIDQATIQKIFDTADIYEVVSDFVSLKKRGINYVGCCPFHNEKTGSFTVSPAKGIYKCFGCGKGGNVVNFIMEHEQMSYVEALRYLAARYNILIEEKELSEEEKKEKSERESMLIVTNYAEDFFVDQLFNTDEGKSVGISYFKRRGLDEETIRKFGLGYNPEAWDAFTKSALEKGYKKEFLIKTGLTIESDRGLFDRFRARVIFPIRDIAGKIIAFGGRIMTNDKKSAKYLNSPESEIYHKSRTLYGIYFAKKSIIQQNRCYLVEGYLDVISFHRKGIENTVASSGTSLTIEQIRLIRRLTPNVTIIYDGDAAGIKASLRGIDLVLEEGLNVRVVSLPDGEDPDSFALAHTPEELLAYIQEHETDFINFKTKLLLGQAGDDPIEKAKLISDIVHSISLIPDAITRSVYVRETANTMKVEENILYNEIARIRHEKAPQNEYKKHPETPPVKVVHEPDATYNSEKLCEIEEMVIIRYLLLFGDTELYEEENESGTCSVSVGEYIIHELNDDDLDLLHPEFNKILHEYQQNYKTTGFIPAKFFIGHIDPAISSIAANILSEPYELSKMWKSQEDTIASEEKILSELLPKILDNYKMRRVDILTQEADDKILELQKNGDTEEILFWIKQKNAINTIRLRLNERLHRTGVSK
ncbi:DNA primase [Odoribacter lunatus]|uniref:DNA primase n=1 Tax=Odoribacter lunatus TaxID=2941335 RepID=UPI00203A6AF7|nr:DNA primase [Odoribacter lunatus]